MIDDRQQDRDGRGRAEAGQHADQHADEHADQAVEQVLRLGDDGEAVEERVESMVGLSEQVGQRDAQPVEEQEVERGDGADADDDRAAPGLAAEEPQPTTQSSSDGISKPMIGSSAANADERRDADERQQADAGERLAVRRACRPTTSRTTDSTTITIEMTNGHSPAPGRRSVPRP